MFGIFARGEGRKPLGYLLPNYRSSEFVTRISFCIGESLNSSERGLKVSDRISSKIEGCHQGRYGSWRGKYIKLLTLVYHQNLRQVSDRHSSEEKVEESDRPQIKPSCSRSCTARTPTPNPWADLRGRCPMPTPLEAALKKSDLSIPLKNSQW